ncbi:uncharacterized protein VP01_83g2 [Puccinia sorghi]|uniref:Uncharacterized protein n=1 Tax=Puccinia sorghi TaxID=27349 RepID=A0A0L6U9E9_9BASI|nr:uncharacterized protein VP01_83g2 [Puccinia sorghi]
MQCLVITLPACLRTSSPSAMTTSSSSPSNSRSGSKTLNINSSTNSILINLKSSDGKLEPDYYNRMSHFSYYKLPFKTAPAEWRTASSGATSSHAWTFKGATTLDREKARAARQEASIGPSPLPATSSKPTAIIGPTLPHDFSRSSSTTLAEHQYKQDEAADVRLLEINARKHEMKRKRKEENEDLAAQRATGKERLLEKRLENRAAQADYLHQKDDPTAVELDDRNLFGSSNSFQEASVLFPFFFSWQPYSSLNVSSLICCLEYRVRARDRAQERRRGKSGNMQAEKQLVMKEKVAAMKSKEDSTMAMLKSLAASKFGPAAGSRQ